MSYRDSQLRVDIRAGTGVPFDDSCTWDELGARVGVCCMGVGCVMANVTVNAVFVSLNGRLVPYTDNVMSSVKNNAGAVYKCWGCILCMD